MKNPKHNIIFEGAELTGKSYLMSQVYNYLEPKYNRAACQRYIIPTEEGIFEKIEGIEKARKMPGVKMFVVFNIPKKGELIKKATNHSERYGQLIAEGKNIRDAVIKCENAMKLIKILVKK